MFRLARLVGSLDNLITSIALLFYVLSESTKNVPQMLRVYIFGNTVGNIPSCYFWNPKFSSIDVFKPPIFKIITIDLLISEFWIYEGLLYV